MYINYYMLRGKGWDWLKTKHTHVWVIKIRLIPTNPIMKIHTIIYILDTQKHVLNHRKIKKLILFLILMLFWIKEAKNITLIYLENKFHKYTIVTTQQARQRNKQILIPTIKHNKKKERRSKRSVTNLQWRFYSTTTS